MEQMYFIGVDLSKSKVDVFVVDASCQQVLHSQVPNNQTKLKAFLKAFLNRNKVESGQVLVCCENTGIYGRHLEQACLTVNVPLWVENAAYIKKATTQLRGKSDLLDSQRIAEYALRYADRKRLFKPLDNSSRQLRDLLHVRETLMDSINRLEKKMKEAKDFDRELYATLREGFSQSLRTMQKNLSKVEDQLKQVVQANESMHHNVQLISSIKGVGMILAMQMVVATDNFTRYKSAKEFACHVGVVPFPNESGKLIKRPRVSRYANKKLKTLFHLGAMAAIRSNSQLRQYYERKVAEGKNKMSTLNAVRNKLIHIIFIVVKRGTPYTLEMPSA